MSNPIPSYQTSAITREEYLRRVDSGAIRAVARPRLRSHTVGPLIGSQGLTPSERTAKMRRERAGQMVTDAVEV